MFYLGDEVTTASRTAYNLLDFLSDVGGLQGIILPIFQFIMSTFYTPFMFSQALISEMFSQQVKSRDSD